MYRSFTLAPISSVTKAACKKRSSSVDRFGRDPAMALAPLQLLAALRGFHFASLRSRRTGQNVPGIHQRSQAKSLKLQDTNFKFQVSSCKTQTSSFKLHVTSFKHQICPCLKYIDHFGSWIQLVPNTGTM